MPIKSCLILLCTSVAMLTGTATAMSPFKKAFDTKFVKNSESDEYKAAFRKSSCYTCHVKGKKKDWLNAYGLELAKLVPGNVKQRLDEAKERGDDDRKAEDDKVGKELLAAFKEAGRLKSPSGEVYDDLFEAHKLPTPEGAKSLLENADDEK
jgi:hypothetical protein